MSTTLRKYGVNYNIPVMELDGLSTDEKPVDKFDGMIIPNGSSFTEIDTGAEYLFDAENGTWYESASGGGGGGGTFNGYTKAEADARFAIKQTESEIVDIKERLDALEYVDIKINSFTASPSVCEMGSSQTVNLAWTLNKTATTQTINGTAVTGNSKQYTGVTANTTYTLAVGDGQTTASKSASVSFANQIYYGVATNLDNVTSLTKVLSNTKGRTITVNAGTGEYIVYAIPARLGNATFYVGGFEGGFESPIEQTLTNASGYSETYKVYRSTNASLGSTTVEIR